MTETREAPNDETSFKDHPLYVAAMQEMADGNEAEAVPKLRELAGLFPEEQVLQELLMRTELRATLEATEPPPPVHGTPAPILRSVVLFLLAITVCLIAVAGFASAYGPFVEDERMRLEQEAHIASMRQKAEALLAAGAWDQALAAYRELLTKIPGDAKAQENIEFIEQRKALVQKYEEALSAQIQGDRQTALDLLYQILEEDNEYLDVRERIAALEKEEALEATWQESETCIQAGDLQCAIDILTQIRKEDPEFRRDQVEEQLYRLYRQLAQELDARANGSVDTLKDAIYYYSKALALRPTQRDLLEARRLARGFVAGAEAFAGEDWVGAIEKWEPVYDKQPGYQNGILRDRLNQAYPRAARHLIDQANGSAKVLKEAMDYIDRAPDDQELIDERHLIVEYLDGAEAFAQEKWNLAIVYWGPIYAVDPGYQNGVLEDYLREACANTEEPDETLCPP